MNVGGEGDGVVDPVGDLAAPEEIRVCGVHT